jgi:hypothetical protein
VQSARRAEPVALVNWPAGQSRQEVEAGAGWYLEAGQEVQTADPMEPNKSYAVVSGAGVGVTVIAVRSDIGVLVTAPVEVE